jgi:hypothetical protein
VVELEHLHRDSALEAVDAADAVSDLQHGADLGEVGLDGEVLDALLEDGGDLFRTKLQGDSFSLGRQGRKRRLWAEPGFARAQPKPGRGGRSAKEGVRGGTMGSPTLA